MVLGIVNEKNHVDVMMVIEVEPSSSSTMMFRKPIKNTYFNFVKE